MNRPLKLAVVTETFPPEVNGVARTIGVMVSELLRRGHQISLFRPRQPGESEDNLDPRMETKLLPGLVLPFYPEVRMGWPTYWHFLKTWRQNPPDLVHVVTEGPLGWSAVRAANRLKIRLVSDFHTNFHTYSSYYKMGLGKHFVNGYLRRFHNKTLCTMVPTNALKESMENMGYHRLSVVGRGVDTQLFDPKRRHQGLRSSWGCGPNDPVCLYVGRLAAEKNLHLVVEAFLAFQQKNPLAKLVVVGDGPWREKVRQLVPDAHFAGVRRGESLARYYASSDFFLFPSLSETFGNVVIEAMASGLAVLSFDDAAAGTYIESGINGLLVDPANTENFVNEAAGLDAGTLRWRSWGKQARQTALSCTWEKVVDDLENVFWQAFSTGGTPSWKAVG